MGKKLPAVCKMSNSVNIRKLEAQLWESADLLRADSKLTSSQYCMPVLALIFLRYAYSRFKLVETEILKGRPVRNGVPLPVEASDFVEKSAIFLPEEARFDFLVNLPDDISSANLKTKDGRPIHSIGEAVNNAMQLVEDNAEQLQGILPKNYDIFSDGLLRELLRIFNSKTLDDVGGDVIGRIYEYFLSKFAKVVAEDDGVFFTPKSLVKMLVYIIEPTRGVMADVACGSGGMFVQTGDFVNQEGMNANTQMTFYGQEKVEYNAQLCMMNMAVHGLNAHIASGDAANTFYNDAWNIAGKCDYLLANPPFNVDKVKAETTENAGRLPFGLPGVNKKTKEVGNANYLWISYFYSYLNDHGRSGFVMASSATDSAGRDHDIREQIVKTGCVDVIISVANNFFYTLSLPCTLWSFNKAKADDIKDKVLFIDARNYYTVVDRTLNEWSDWQLRNLQAIVHLYRGERDKYTKLIADYHDAIAEAVGELTDSGQSFADAVDGDTRGLFLGTMPQFEEDFTALRERLERQISQTKICVSAAEKTIKKRDVKAMRQKGDDFIGVLQSIITVIDDRQWLVSKFGEGGTYQDVAGLCKIATTAEIAEKNYSLTPGAYVGVAAQEDDGVDFHERMTEIHEELNRLNGEANKLMEEINKNWEEISQ